MKVHTKKAYIIITVALLALSPVFGRASVNMAANTITAEDFFLEKQKHDAALSAEIEFYPLDSWYFSLLLSKHSSLMLMNTYAPGMRDIYGTPESSFLWYMDISDGLYPEYAPFIPYANYVIAKCLRTGCGVIKDYARSREFAEKSYKAGFAGGNLLIADEIEGCWADKETAKLSVKKLYDSAAKEEFPECFLRLARNSSGAERKKYLDKAMAFNVSEAYYMAAQDILEMGKGNITDDSAAELLETASVLLEEAEGLYHAKSAMLLGDFYAGTIPAQTEYSTPLCYKQSNPFHNQEKALEYYMNAAMYGEPRGFAALAAIYREGYFDTTDKNMASFYYYKYRDTLYDEKLARKEKMEAIRDFYESGEKAPDETICMELGQYYSEAETDEGEKDGLAWLNEGAKKGSSLCMYLLGTQYEGKPASLNFYKQAVNSSNKFPLDDSKTAKTFSKLDDIYAQVLQGGRFKNNVEYWLNSMDDKNFSEKKEVEKNTELLKVATKSEAMRWFKTRAESGGKFEKTWYAWLLLEDNDATSRYDMKAASVRPDRDVAAVWGIIQDVLKEDPEYAPALVCQGRCLTYAYGTGRKKPKDARASFEAAANLNYSEAWGWLAITARDKDEQKEFITNGCASEDEYSYYLSFSTLIWLSGQTDIKDSLIAAVKYGYIESYVALIKQRIQDVSVTFDGDYSNLDEAYQLAVFAETAGISSAKDQRLRIEKYYGDKMTLSSFTVNEAINRAKKKVSSGAENADALYTLAEAYNDAGTLVNGSDELAAKYYLMAAKLDKVEAMEKIASCYYYGRGVPKNYASAYLWYNAAELNGSENVYPIIGTMLIEGEGCERDVEKGLGYYKTESSLHPSSQVVKILNCFEGLPESFSRKKD